MSLKEQLKIKPFQAYVKIQEAFPVHYSNLINKELGYDTIIDRDGGIDGIKIKNCICSARPNSELFKRMSRSFLSNLRS